MPRPPEADRGELHLSGGEIPSYRTVSFFATAYFLLDKLYAYRYCLYTDEHLMLKCSI
jgi:hypothetical protein